MIKKNWVGKLACFVLISFLVVSFGCEMPWNKSTGSNTGGKDYVISSVEVFCAHSVSNGDFFVEAFIKDPETMIKSAFIGGSMINGKSPLIYDISPNQFNERWWWTNPNIFISKGTIPIFPLSYTVYINFKDGTSEEVIRSVSSWRDVN